jgi:hypothetical protein
MTSDEIRQRLRREPDFIALPRFNYSLASLVERYPDGVPEKLVAEALDMTEEDAQILFESAVKKLRRAMGVKK